MADGCKPILHLLLSISLKILSNIGLLILYEGSIIFELIALLSPLSLQ